MQRADELLVVHHDDTTSTFTKVHYTLDRTGLRITTTDGTEHIFPRHEILTTHVLLSHPLAHHNRTEIALAA